MLQLAILLVFFPLITWQSQPLEVAVVLAKELKLLKMREILYQEIRVQEKVKDINLPKKIRPLRDEA